MENKIELRPVELDENYCKKWNVHEYDFFHLYVNGVRTNNSLYRVGGFGVNIKEKYFMLLKQVESNYSQSVMDACKQMAKKEDRKYEQSSRHLANCSCIVDNNGVEKKVFTEYGTPYLCGGCVYVINNDYYNIETNEKYCSSFSSMKSKDFIFLNNEYDNDKSKRGIIKIDKLTGAFELFKNE